MMLMLRHGGVRFVHRLILSGRLPGRGCFGPLPHRRCLLGGVALLQGLELADIEAEGSWGIEPSSTMPSHAEFTCTTI